MDSHLCESHALCVEIAPTVFDLGDSDIASCAQHPADDVWDKVLAAVDACPRGAISVIED